MREFLTALAAIVILALTAALAGPYFVRWEDHRDVIQSRIAELTGRTVRLEGSIDIRLLPTPTISIERVDVAPQGGRPGARLEGLAIDLSLVPLMQRQLHFTTVRARVLETSLDPATLTGGAFPFATASPATEGSEGWPVAIDELIIEDGRLHVSRPDGTRRTISPIRIVGETRDIRGPWRVQANIAGVAARFTTGDIASGKPVRLLAVIGGESHPRLEFDGTVGETIQGGVRLTIGPPVQPADSGAPVPVIFNGRMDGTVQRVSISDITVDVADGPAALRFEGQGALVLEGEPSLDLAFASRFIDADAFLLSPAGQAFLKGSNRGFGAWPIRTRIGLKVDTVTLGNEETGSLQADVEVAEFGAALKRFAAILPGRSRVTFEGSETRSSSHLFGRLAVDSQNSEALAAFLAQFGGPSTAVRFASGGPFTLSSDLVVTREVIAARSLDWRSGQARVTGTVRYTPADSEGGRARLDAQLSATGLDLATLPDLDGMRRSLSATDFDLALSASDLRYGATGTGGRLQATLSADATGLSVRTLDVADLAGANARASGSLTQQGEARIEGSITSRRVGPLLTLAGKVWGSDSLVAGIPPTVDQAPLDARFTITSSSRSAAEALVLQLDGTSGGMRVSASSATSRNEQGALDTLTRAELVLNAARSSELLRLAGLDVPGLPERPGEARLTLSQMQGLGTAVELTAADGLWRIATRSPVPLRGRIETEREGVFAVSADDASPWLKAWKLVPAGDRTARPFDVVVKVRPAGGRWALEPEGRLGSEPVKAVLTVNPAGRQVSGQVETGRISAMPLIEWAGLSAQAPAQAGTIWSIARFAPFEPLPFNAELAILAREVDLGAGRIGTDASATILMGPESLSLRPFRVSLGDVVLSGEISASRQGGRAALAGEIAVSDLLALTPSAGSVVKGTMATRIRFGAAGETPTTMVSNLTGAGQVQWRDAAMARFAPGALAAVAATEARADGDVPTPDRLRAVLGQAFDRASFPLGSQEAAATLTAGVMRIGPLIAETPESRLNLQLLYDWRTLIFEARGFIQAASSPPGWIGGAPQVAVTWKGQTGQAAVAREIDPTGLINGLAAVRLSREVERIERMEADDRERSFFNRRLRAERERAEQERQAERERVAREQAERERERQERLRQERERLERDRLERERAAQPPTNPGSLLPPLEAPLEIRPQPRSALPLGGPVPLQE